MRGVPAIPASVLFMLIEELSRVSRVDTFQVWRKITYPTMHFWSSPRPRCTVLKGNHLTHWGRIFVSERRPCDASEKIAFSNIQLSRIGSRSGAIGTNHWYNGARMAGSLHSVVAIAKTTQRPVAAASGSDPRTR